MASVSIKTLALLALASALIGPVASCAAEGQPTELRAWHAAGQTFLVWKQSAQAGASSEGVTVERLGQLRAELDKSKKIRYCVYRSPQPIASLKDLQLIAEVPPLSVWNSDYYGGTAKPTAPALRYVVEEGKEPLPPDAGVCVHNPQEDCEAYYAVAVSIARRVNDDIGEGNCLKAPVKETVGQGAPVLQRIERPKEFNYVSNPALHYYVRWEAPPNCSMNGKPYDYLVAIPPKLAKPAPVGIHLHCWGGNLNTGYGWWFNAEKGAILISSNQIPYDWWTGYHELLWAGKPLQSREDFQKGVVRAYTQARLLSFLDWVAMKWDVDQTRVFTAGASMGGSGAPMFAIRHPERIAWAIGWVGVHIPQQSPTFKSSYELVYGKPEFEVKFEDGAPVWDYFNDAWFLRNHPEKEIGFISFSNGKNDGGIGWPQAVEFLKALQETKRPHLFVWGMMGHGQRAIMPANGGERVNPLDVRTDQSLPAFTHCSLDNNPGGGAPDDGDKEGQVNQFLTWETKDIVDEPERWEMTIGLIPQAPKNDCTVNVTPRRCQKFKTKPGEKLKWTAQEQGKEAQSGETTADQHGLVTLEAVRVAKAALRLAIIRP